MKAVDTLYPPEPETWSLQTLFPIMLGVATEGGQTSAVFINKIFYQ